MSTKHNPDRVAGIAQQDRQRKQAKQDKLRAEIQARMDFAALPAWKRTKLRAQGKAPGGWT